MALLRKLQSNRLMARTAGLVKLGRAQSFLGRSGWFRSLATGTPVDAAGEPLPWYTYSAIDFLAARIGESFQVFEYGSGYSTLWWARRANAVVSCEHDADWYRRMQPSLPQNVIYRHVGLDEPDAYARTILNYERQFDVVVIDGRDRVSCARHALERLNDDGIVVWDNSERDDYREGYETLREHGFRRLDFNGMGPINAYGWSTSVFYRRGNCIGI